MKHLHVCSAALGLLPALASAGTLYGTVRVAGRPAAGAAVLVACPSFAQPAQSAQATADGRGSYTLRINGRGRCEMRLVRDGQEGPPFAVFVSEGTARYDANLGASLAPGR
jgi:hypothetical protein